MNHAGRAGRDAPPWLPMIRIVLAAILLAALSGCGNGRKQGLVDVIVSEFASKADVTLTHQKLPALPGLKPLALVPDPAATKRFGGFRIFVLPNAEQAKALARGVYSRDGVSWTAQTNELQKHSPTYWNARKAYGRVVLSWWNSKQQLNENWTQLDQLVRGAARAASGHGIF